MMEAAVAMLFGLAVADVSSNSTVGVPGTYEIGVCEGPCDFSWDEVEVTGWLVLAEVPIDLGCLSLTAKATLKVESRPLLGRNVANACFVFSKAEADSPTFAGIIPFALTTWTSIGEGLIEVPLYGSPDAESLAVGEVRDGFIRANVRDSGFLGRDFSYVRGHLIGVRLGPPDLGICERAAEAGAIMVFDDEAASAYLELYGLESE